MDTVIKIFNILSLVLIGFIAFTYIFIHCSCPGCVKHRLTFTLRKPKAKPEDTKEE